MPSLTVRYLEPEVLRELRILAARNGRSMQAELKIMILRHMDSPEAQAEDPARIPIALLKVPKWYDELFEVWGLAFALCDAELPRWTSTLHGRPAGVQSDRTDAQSDRTGAP